MKSITRSDLKSKASWDPTRVVKHIDWGIFPRLPRAFSVSSSSQFAGYGGVTASAWVGARLPTRCRSSQSGSWSCLWGRWPRRCRRLGKALRSKVLKENYFGDELLNKSSIVNRLSTRCSSVMKFFKRLHQFATNFYTFKSFSREFTS